MADNQDAVLGAFKRLLGIDEHSPESERQADFEREAGFDRAAYTAKSLRLLASIDARHQKYAGRKVRIALEVSVDELDSLMASIYQRRSMLAASGMDYASAGGDPWLIVDGRDRGAEHFIRELGNLAYLHSEIEKQVLAQGVEKPERAD